MRLPVFAINSEFTVAAGAFTTSMLVSNALSGVSVHAAIPPHSFNVYVAANHHDRSEQNNPPLTAQSKASLHMSALVGLTPTESGSLHNFH